jgi:hypothetical protein
MAGLSARVRELGAKRQLLIPACASARVFTTNLKEFSMATSTNPLANLAAAELAIVLKPINDFLTALQQPGVNVAAVLQDFTKLQLEILGDVPALEAVGIGNIAAYLQQELNGWVNSQTNPPA